MEKPKPAQNHEQERPKTLEDYAVKTFPADLDVTIRPLTVIRSGKDGGGIRDDEGWTPGDMLCVRKEGIGSIELFVKVHKLIKVYGEHVYEECVPITKIVSLKKLQSREENKGFNEFYIQELYGKSTEEMIEEGERAAEQISNSSVVEEGGSDLERPKVSLKIGSTAVEAAGVEKPIYTNKVKTNEPVREPVKTDKTGVGSPALKIPEPTMELIRATEANGAVGLPAVESVKKPAVKATGIKKPVETGLDESDNSELDRFDERVRELMKPLEADVDGMPFEDESVRVNYDYLYDPNYVPSNNVEDAAVRNPKGVPVSENSFNAAKEAIYDLATNPSLMQIINPERALDPEAIINGIRSSHLTRCRLFEYLTSSLDRLAVVHPDALSDRVLRDSEDNLKSPNYLGGNYYAGKMRSREYTVVLAIAMMDGSFDVDRQDKMVTHYRGGKERSGMHRDSARALLEYVRNNY